MENALQALMFKKFKDAEADLDIGRHWIDETVVVRFSGSVERYEDQWIAPTISIPLIPTIAFFWERLGVEKDAAMSVLREAIAEAMRAKTNESPSIKSKMDDVAEAVCVAMVDPLVSPSVRLTLLKGRGINDGALPYTLRDTPLHQLFWDVANRLMQIEFPPSVEKITVHHPDFFPYRNGDNDDNDETAPALNRWDDFAIRNAGHRYEWVGEDQQLVCVGANLMVSLRHKGRKARGL